MLNKKQEEEFQQMVENGIEDLSHPQSDEQELTYEEVQQVRKAAGRDYEIFADHTLASASAKKDKAVDNPSHYDVADTTIQEMLEAMFTHEEFMGWIKGNIIKYRMRAFKKENVGVQDIAKADKYQRFYDDYKLRNQPHGRS